jgi:oxygen-dependent protoporphyrinogen oxidase
VAVVGGGIAGLAAAWELVAGPAAGDGPVPDVVVLEAEDRLGGKLRAQPFAGRRVDVAADAFLARRPEATELCDELGLTDALVPIGASGASIWARGRLRPMPEGLNLGVPTRWWPLVRRGILGPAESLRVLRDLFTPHLGTGTAFGDRAVGEIVGERLGRPVVDRLTDPLIGGIHAGSADQLSAAATFPALIAASHQTGSLMRSLGAALARTPPTGPGRPQPPVFWSLAGTTASLVDDLTGALLARGVSISTGTAVQTIEPGADGPGVSRWTLALGSPGSGPGGGGILEVDGVILAAPAPETAVLLASVAPRAAGVLSTIRYASVAVITLTLPEGSVGAPMRGTGFLVPRTSTIDGQPALITGCTYLGRKWPHLARPGDELIRASVGRFGDDRHAGLDDEQLTASVLGELRTVLDVRADPREVLVTRWDRAFPQYEVGHLIRVARIEEDLTALPGLAVAGAALRGVGIPACIGSGRTAARRVLASLAGRTDPTGGGPDGFETGP